MYVCQVRLCVSHQDSAIRRGPCADWNDAPESQGVRPESAEGGRRVRLLHVSGLLARISPCVVQGEQSARPPVVVHSQHLLHDATHEDDESGMCVCVCTRVCMYV
jgi:hypothetical protein